MRSVFTYDNTKGKRMFDCSGWCMASLEKKMQCYLFGCIQIFPTIEFISSPKLILLVLNFVSVDVLFFANIYCQVKTSVVCPKQLGAAS